MKNAIGNLIENALNLWRRQWHPTAVLLPGKSHGRRSLVGCSPWGREESDMTEQLHFHFSLSCIGEGNGTPLQCSCLENPRDGGAWWAAVYGVAQSQTWLKWLRSSSSSSINGDPVWNHHIVNYIEGTQWRIAYNEGINRDLGSDNYEASSNLPRRTDLCRV